MNVWPNYFKTFYEFNGTYFMDTNLRKSIIYQLENF